MNRRVTLRIALTLGMTALASGCSMIESLASGTAAYVPGRVYLSDEFFTVDSRAEMDKYVCRSGPLMCTQFGQRWSCGCGGF